MAAHKCHTCGDDIDMSHWRHFVFRLDKRTWSVSKKTHPSYVPSDGVEEITLQEQAELRFQQGYKLVAWP